MVQTNAMDISRLMVLAVMPLRPLSALLFLDFVRSILTGDGLVLLVMPASASVYIKWRWFPIKGRTWGLMGLLLLVILVESVGWLTPLFTVAKTSIDVGSVIFCSRLLST